MAGNKPLLAVQGLLCSRGGFCGMRRWRTGDAQILGFDSAPGEGKRCLQAVTVNQGILKGLSWKGP